MPLTLYNSKVRQKQRFVPIEAGNVRLYVCGPTVYDFAHIGNARPVIVFDVLFRLLRQLYGAEHVTYVRNITDVDDKINQRAAEEGVDIAQLTQRTITQFHADMDALRALRPTVEPRATEHIAQMIAMIETLIARGHAYEAQRHVLFHVPSMPDYGQLSGRSLEEMQAGARVEVAPYKRDPMDFVLWKPSIGVQPGWDSPWGRGRPGWHIECSAMSATHLGETFDIHGGGIDLLFPHHENEVAQSTCAHGSKVMANYWLHNGYLQVEGEKMSKSLGNFVTVHELLEQWPGEVLRLAMLMTHYRQPINWTRKTLQEAARIHRRWSELTQGFRHSPAPLDEGSPVMAALMDDLNTPGALSALHALAKQAPHDKEARGQLLAGLILLGLMQDPEERVAENRRQVAQMSDEFRALRKYAKSPTPGRDIKHVMALIDPETLNAKIEQRLQARADKNWSEADRIRDELAELGIALKDGPDGTRWEVIR